MMRCCQNSARPHAQPGFCAPGRSASLNLPRAQLIRKGGCFWTLALLLILSLQALTFGDDTATLFDRANRLYEQGNYPEAIGGYQKLLEEKKVSPAVYFNLGNAFFRNGQTGEAIAAYLLARRQAPRDPDILANLRFARERVQGGTSRRSIWDRMSSRVTLDELTLWTMALLWCWLLLLAAGQVQRQWRRSLGPFCVVFGIMAALSAVWLGVVYQIRLARPAAVVVAKDAPVHYGPFSESKAGQTLHDGAELKVLDQKDTWLQVEDGQGAIGWLQRDEVTILPRG